ncbi:MULTISPECIES: preprotein translocase subunit SecE [Arthrobacter]|uniref:Protein translocase subunit SecE n=1 Tax=Arthrobacter caoxuetaonis TaxID=2886935 RepID=A0A9X1MCK6_9MICC|nr:preprotein translocase subunit SecE [Arthrobacter caoxuetaonis]MCC3281222.1 preprotein translocase subunit SecE [Arthrobacter caoxuetaonis]MCC3296527.1 preprotein translocase subunit SecE [Arthrobacter caoxuetaonis]MCC9192603.1 preprotein translocase subunit SecE [Arthrobacter sp. zg-Y916]USQ56641.1 preprotein translocase subunit SecE [Arthrobacter caoxuetaonis]
MTETAASSSKGHPSGKPRKRGFFAGIALFLRQVIAELKKVVTPTRKELLRFTIVVMAFVVVMMIIVSLLDFIFGTGALWIFGSGGGES